jgi:hypothetical protein
VTLIRAARVFGIALLVGMACIAWASKMPFWGAKESRPADTPFAELKQGEFIWIGDVARSGPLLMVVSLDEQRAYVYRNGVLTGVTTVSTGKKGHETPTGVFTILQKNKDHFSNIYDNAPMPYMQRLTWGGIALHAGGLPGYPASHGCIRLPSEFARQLFEGHLDRHDGGRGQRAQRAGAGGVSRVPRAGHSDRRARDHAATHGVRVAALAPGGGARRSAERGAEPPERPPGRCIARVWRSGGRASVFHGGEPIGTHVLLMVEGAALTPQRYNPRRDAQRWVEVDIAGYGNRSGSEPDAALAQRIEIPPQFVALVSQVLVPGRHGAGDRRTDHSRPPAARSST